MLSKIHSYRLGRLVLCISMVFNDVEDSNSFENIYHFVAYFLLY